MTVIRNNSISGINSITAQSGALNFYDSTGNTLSIGASVSGNITGDVTGNLTGNVTVATGATISGSTNTIVASTNGSERVRIDSSGRLIVGVNGATSTTCSAIFQGRSDGATNSAVIRLAKGSSTPGSTDSLGIIQFSDSGTKHAAQIQAQRDGGTWTSGTQTPAALLFFTSPDSATGATERLRITSGGNVQIANGNLVFSTAGTGIDFSADSNAAGMTSELLDDYEEGAYTPVLSGGGYTYGVGQYTAGRYTKVGRQVTVDASINISTISGSSDGSAVRITLPFNPVSLTGGARWAQTPCRLAYFSSTAIQRIYCVQLTTNSSSLDLVYYYTSGSNGTNTSVNIGADYESASNNGQIAFTISYITS